MQWSCNGIGGRRAISTSFPREQIHAEKKSLPRARTDHVAFHEELTHLTAREKKYFATCQRMALTVLLAGLQSLSRVTILSGGRVGLGAENVSD